MFVRSPTLHHAEGVLYLRFEQVDAHHRGQILHVHLVHRRVQLHLEQEAANRRRQGDNVRYGSLEASPLPRMLFPASAHRHT